MNDPLESHNEQEYEQTHVHNVYNSIASHFSQTRYKPWPIVEQFLKDLPSGSVGLDIGCGNGKYLAVRDDIYVIGSDRSDELIKIAKKHEQHDALVGDALDPPHPTGRFDFVISIAVLHHLSVRARRVEGVRAALDKLKRAKPHCASVRDDKEDEAPRQRRCNEGGQALFFVWALEQKGSRRGWDEGGDQDVLVPWVLKPPTESSKQGKSDKPKKKGKKRSEHVDTTKQHDGQPASPLDNVAQQHSEVDGEPQHSLKDKVEQVYHRYYHLYRQGELEEDIVSAGGQVVENGYDRDNWWCIARRKPEC